MDVFSALADPVRRDLLVRLASAPVTVNALVMHHPVTRPAISRHLRVLREAGLITVRTSGRQRIHEINRGALEPVRRLVANLDGSPPFEEYQLDALGLEVRRTVRERSGKAQATPISDEEAG